MRVSSGTRKHRAGGHLDCGEGGHKADGLLDEVEQPREEAADDEVNGVAPLVADAVCKGADHVAHGDDRRGEAERAAGGAQRVAEGPWDGAEGLAVEVPARHRAGRERAASKSREAPHPRQGWPPWKGPWPSSQTAGPAVRSCFCSDTRSWRSTAADIGCGRAAAARMHAAAEVRGGPVASVAEDGRQPRSPARAAVCCRRG